MYQFTVPAFKSDSATLVAVFSSPEKKITVPVSVSSGATYSTRDFPELSFVDKSTVAYLQLRGTDGSRRDATLRARLGWLAKLEDFSTEPRLPDAKTFNEKEHQGWVLALHLAMWIQDADASKNVQHILEFSLKHGEPIEHTKIHSIASDAFQTPNKPSLHIIGKVGTNRSHTETHPKAGQVFPSFAEFLKSSSVPQGRFRIMEHNVTADFEFEGAQKQPLLVILHGRKGPRVHLPYLSGRHIVEGINVARLSISDPSLYLDESLSISWFTGNSSAPNLQMSLARVIQEIANRINASKVIFLGGSAGGFASLVFAHLIPNSLAIVWNPQTDIAKYYPRFYREYLNICWGGNSKMLQESGVITSVVDLYDVAKQPSSTVYVLQEPTDVHHVTEHLMPFLGATKCDRNVFTYRQHWGEGHVPPAKDTIRRLIEHAIAENPQDLFIAEGFQPSVDTI